MQFCSNVQGEIARLRIQSRSYLNENSVLLTETTRTKIEHYIGRLRDTIDKSDLDLERKKALNDKLEQMLAELANSRLNFSKTMRILAAVVATLAAGVTIAAEGQNAITHIIRLVGEDNASEEEARKRLTPPLKALPKPQTKPTPRRQLEKRSNVSLELDDDIPF